MLISARSHALNDNMVMLMFTVFGMLALEGEKKRRIDTVNWTSKCVRYVLFHLIGAAIVGVILSCFGC